MRTSPSLSRWALVALATGLAGCFVPVPEGPPSGYETTILDCTNGFDDDNDRAVDCRDTDCISRGFCTQVIPIDFVLEPEDTAERCVDRIDNDDDGRFDCGDPDCTVILELCCSLEFDNASCSNGVDDDGNGFIDCVDSGCSRNPFVTVCEVETNCNDILDNDGDRRRDCDDTDCATAANCVPGGEESCENGDDDGDGRADCEDRDCYTDGICLGPENKLARCVDGNNNDGNDDGTAPSPRPLVDCTEPTCQALGGDDAVIFAAYCAGLSGPENTLARCMDGVDNDGNNFLDCADFSCSRGGPDIVMYCAGLAENTVDKCSDRVDNDGNGFTDCRDFSCTMASRGATPEAIAYCMTAVASENTSLTCVDGLDNDSNGYVDCADRNCCMAGMFVSGRCSGYLDEVVTTYCASILEDNPARCSDGVDNDRNGFADCADFSCSRSADPEVLVYCANNTESNFARCTDGIDNDANSFSDCEDFSCRDVLEEFVTTVPGTAPMRTGQQRSPCTESVGSTPEWQRHNCTDGLDNDQDGFADCEDWDCNWNPATRSLCPARATPCATDAECGANRVCRNEMCRTLCPAAPATCRGVSSYFTDCADEGGELLCVSRPRVCG